MCLPLAFNLLQLLLLEVLLLLFLLLLLAFAQVSVTAAGNHSLLQVTHTHTLQRAADATAHKCHHFSTPLERI